MHAANRERPRRRPCRFVAAAWMLAGTVCLGGCGTDAATLELIGAARLGLDSAREGEQAHHERWQDQIETQRDALAAAFDADVRLAASGQITGADGEPVELSPEWVICARKGYAAALGMLAEQDRRAQAAHATRMDNLAAARECLEMARELLLRRAELTGRVRGILERIERRWTHE